MNEYLERTNTEREKALSECPPNSGYNIVPMASEPYPEVNPESAPRVRNIPPFEPAAKPRPFRLFFCGIQWAVIFGIVLGAASYCAHRKLAAVPVTTDIEISVDQVPAEALAAFDRANPRISEEEALQTLAPKTYWARLWAGGAVLLALAVAALGLVWGVFQHVLKTIVQIVRTK